MLQDDSEYLKAQDDPECLKAQDDPECLKAQDDPECLKAQDDPECLKAQDDSEYLKVQVGEPHFYKKGTGTNIDIINARHGTSFNPDTLSFAAKRVAKPYAALRPIIIKRLLQKDTIAVIANQTGISRFRITSTIAEVLKLNIEKLRDSSLQHGKAFDQDNDPFKESTIERVAEILKQQNLLHQVRQRMPNIWEFLLTGKFRNKDSSQWISRIQYARLSGDFIALLKDLNIAQEINLECIDITSSHRQARSFNLCFPQQNVFKHLDMRQDHVYVQQKSWCNNHSFNYKHSMSRAGRKKSKVSNQQPYSFQNRLQIQRKRFKYQPIRVVLGHLGHEIIRTIDGTCMKCLQQNIPFLQFKQRVLGLKPTKNYLTQEQFEYVLFTVDDNQMKLLLELMLKFLEGYNKKIMEGKTKQSNKIVHCELGNHLRKQFQKLMNPMAHHEIKEEWVSTLKQKDSQQGQEHQSHQVTPQQRLIEKQSEEEDDNDGEVKFEQSDQDGEIKFIDVDNMSESLKPSGQRFQGMKQTVIEKNRLIKLLEEKTKTKALQKEKLKSEAKQLNKNFEKQETAEFDLDNFFRASYWRIVTVFPPGPRKKDLGVKNLELVADPYLFAYSINPHFGKGRIQITHLSGGSLGRFLIFQKDPNFKYVTLQQPGSTELFKFKEFTNKSTDKELQINIREIFANGFKVTVKSPPKDLKGVSMIFKPIKLDGKPISIIYSQPYNPPKTNKVYITFPDK